MNLKEWSEKTGIRFTSPTTEKGAVSVLISEYYPEYNLLWNLSDYYVSSVAGIVVWLVPKQQNITFVEFVEKFLNRYKLTGDKIEAAQNLFRFSRRLNEEQFIAATLFINNADYSYCLKVLDDVLLIRKSEV